MRRGQLPATKQLPPEALTFAADGVRGFLADAADADAIDGLFANLGHFEGR